VTLPSYIVGIVSKQLKISTVNLYTHS